MNQAQELQQGGNLSPNWTVWFSFTTVSLLCCLTNTLAVNPWRSATSQEGSGGISPLVPLSVLCSQNNDS